MPAPAQNASPARSGSPGGSSRARRSRAAAIAAAGTMTTASRAEAPSEPTCCRSASTPAPTAGEDDERKHDDREDDRVVVSALDPEHDRRRAQRGRVHEALDHSEAAREPPDRREEREPGRDSEVHRRAGSEAEKGRRE